MKQFDEMVAEWQSYQDGCDALAAEQRKLGEKISELFEEVVIERKLLSKISWTVEVRPRITRDRYVLLSSVDDEEFEKLLDTVIWSDDSKHYYHFSLKIGDRPICVDDGTVSIDFIKAQDLLDFCKRHHISPDKKSLIRDRDQLLSQAKGYDRLIDHL